MSTITNRTILTGITLSASGTYDSPLTITATGAVEAATTNSSYAAIYGPPASPGRC